MNDIKFKIEKQILARMDSEKVVDWSKGYLNAEFELRGSDWTNDTNYTKYALFRHGELSFAVELNRKSAEEPIYVCSVPHEILRYSSFILTVYAAGKKDTDVIHTRITTNSLNINVDASNFTTDLMSTKNPSKDAFVDIYDKLDLKMDISAADTKIETAITDAINKIRFPEFTIVSDSSKTNPGNLAGQKGDIWLNIFTTVSADTPPAITTTILKFKHNGDEWVVME